MRSVTMESTKLRKFDKFIIEFNKKIGIAINEKLDKGEIKVVLTEDYINKTLKINYKTDNLYAKLRNMLMETDSGLNVSIKRKSKEFIFFKSSKNIKRETDLIKVVFEKKLMEYITTYPKDLYSKTLEENILKKYLGITHSSDFLIKKLSNILSQYNIKVYLENGNFIFCNEEKRIEIENFNYELQLDRERKEKERIREIEEKIKDENAEIINKTPKKIIVDKIDEIKEIEEKIKNENSEIEKDEFLCPACKMKVNNLESPCKKCTYIIDWELK